MSPSRALRGDDSGVSEVVGALMLVLVVLAAATSFGLFLQDQQEKTQRQKASEGARARERLEVLAVEPVLNTTAGDRWLTLNFTVASLHGEPSRLRDVRIHGQPVEEYTVWRTNRTTGGLDREDVVSPDAAALAPYEHAYFLIDLDHAFFAPQTVFTADAVDLEVLTDFLNPFARTFLPPEAIAVLDVQAHWNGTAYVGTPVLDGALSAHPEPDGRIVRWAWSVDGGATLLGRRLLAPFACDGGLHDIDLVVTDRHGLVASTRLEDVSC